MKYIPGQKIRIKRSANLDNCMSIAASRLNPPYIGTIDGIVPDPHDGVDMYLLKECHWGWYEREIEGLYYEEIRITNRFEILDL